MDEGGTRPQHSLTKCLAHCTGVVRLNCQASTLLRFRRGASVLERELSARNARGRAGTNSAIRYDVGEICLRLDGLRACRLRWGKHHVWKVFAQGASRSLPLDYSICCRFFWRRNFETGTPFA
jgi:hypothetical protein